MAAILGMAALIFWGLVALFADLQAGTPGAPAAAAQTGQMSGLPAVALSFPDQLLPVAPAARPTPEPEAALPQQKPTPAGPGVKSSPGEHPTAAPTRGPAAASTGGRPGVMESRVTENRSDSQSVVITNGDIEKAINSQMGPDLTR